MEAIRKEEARKGASLRLCLTRTQASGLVRSLTPEQAAYRLRSRHMTSATLRG